MRGIGRTTITAANSSHEQSRASSGRRLSRAFWSGADAAAAPMAALGISSGLVRTLGPQDYGVLVVALAISALSLAINPAIAATTTKLVAETAALDGGGERRTSRLITASLLAVAALGLIFLLGAGVFIDPLARLLFGAAAVRDREDQQAIILLAVASVCIQQLDGVCAAALKGLERFKEQALFELSSRLSVAVAVVGVAWMVRDIRVVLLTMCGTLILSTLLRAVLLRALAPDRLILSRPRSEEVQGLLSFGGWMWLNATATAAYGTVDRVIIGRFLGMAAAAEFHIYVQISQLIHYIPSSVFAYAFPVFSRLSAAGAVQRPALKRMYGRLLATILATAAVSGTGLMLLRHPVLSLFAGRGLLPSKDWAFMLLISGFAVLALNIAPYYLLLGLGRSRAVSLVTSLSVLVAVVLAWVLVPVWGLTGAALARFGYVFGTLVLLERAQRTLRMIEIT